MCPPALHWLRYTAFIVLYPLGFAGELGTWIAGFPHMKVRKRHLLTFHLLCNRMTATPRHAHISFARDVKFHTVSMRHHTVPIFPMAFFILFPYPRSHVLHTAIMAVVS